MYEARLLKFLQDHPTLKLTHIQIAGIWKRNTADVGKATRSLINSGRIKMGKYGVLSLPCEGIGGA